MHLSRLRLKGFKSFGEPSVVKFSAGVCAIVGPNGSGKSNVVDALAWVLGAQSPRLLRLSHMEDVIYQGSPSRPALGRAEVVLELETDEGERSLGGLAEIAISRSVLRSGESEYRLNGETCRLSDLVELLGEANVGRSQHVLITQGEIDGLVNAKGDQIRAVMEDAAQVSPLRRRYDQTQRNLLAVDSRLAEVAARERELKRRIKPLRQQAELYARREELSSRHGEISRYLARVHLLGLDDRASVAESSVQVARQEIAELRSRLGSLQAIRPRSDDETLTREANALAQRVMALRERVANHLALVSDQASALRERMREFERANGERVRIGENRTQLLARVGDLEARAATLASERRETAELLAEREAHVPGSPEELQLRVNALAARIVGAKEAREREERRARAAKDQRERLARYDGDIVAHTAKVEESQLKVDDCEGQLAAAADALAFSREGLARHESEWESVDDRYQQLARELGAAKAEYEGLCAVLSQGEQGGGGQRLLSVMDPEQGYEAAVAATVGEWADARVFDTQEELLSAARSAGGSFVGTVVRAADLGVGSTLARWVPPQLSSLLARVRVVGSVLDALESGSVSDFMVDGEGNVYRDGLLLTRRVSSGVMERRVTWLAGRLHEIDVELESCGHESARKALSAAKSALREAEETYGSSERRYQEARRQLEREQFALEGVERERRVVAETDLSDAEPGVETELDVLLEEQRVLRTNIAEAERAREQALEEVRRIQRSDVELRLAAATLGAEVAGVRDRLSDLEVQERELGDRGGEPVPKDLIAGLARREEDLRRLLGALGTVRNRVEGALEDAASLREQRRHDHEEQEQERFRLAESLERAEQGLVTAVASASEARTRFLSECEATERELGCATEEILQSPLPEGVAPTSAKALLEEVSRAIAQLGAVNPLAFAELAELTEDLEVLESGSKDVRDTAAQLREALCEVEEEMVERIRRVVSETSSAFAALMSRLFLGGSGSLEFESESDPLQSPLIISVSVPSRKVSRLAALSGGERSLVGIAFLFAIMTVRPAPFVVLDEVEAALDEKNLAAFASLISEWGVRTQVLVVTHQRRTMEVADLLLGVSMDESGVSRVLAHRLSNERSRV